MGKQECEIVQDLMPLYVDDVVSNSSRELVEEHIRSCNCCRDLEKEFRKPALIMDKANSQRIERDYYRTIQSKIKTNYGKAAWLLILAVLICFAVRVYINLCNPVSFSDETAVMRIQEIQNEEDFTNLLDSLEKEQNGLQLYVDRNDLPSENPKDYAVLSFRVLYSVRKYVPRLTGSIDLIMPEALNGRIIAGTSISGTEMYSIKEINIKQNFFDSEEYPARYEMYLIYLGDLSDDELASLLLTNSPELIMNYKALPFGRGTVYYNDFNFHIDNLYRTSLIL